MLTLRPSDNPVDFEKNNNNNNKCGSLSHIITIYAVSSGLCREATQRELLRRRSTTQADSIRKISFCCEISLRKQPTLLDATSGFFAKRRRNKVCRPLSSPVLLVLLFTLMYEEDNLWFSGSFSSQLPNPESTL